MFKLKAQTKILILLIIPCVIFSAIIVFISNNYLFQFFRSTQKDSLEKISEQMVFSIVNSVDSVNSLLLTIEKNGIVNGKTENLEDFINTIFKYKVNYLKGIVFLKEDGSFVGVPSTYWYFGETEKMIIKNLQQETSEGISWSGRFYSMIDTNTTEYDPMGVAIKPIYYNERYIGVLAVIINLSEFISETSVYSSYDITTYLYEKDGSLVDSLQYRRGSAYLLTPESFTTNELRNMDTAVDYLAGNNMYYSISEMAEYPNWSILVVGDIQKFESKFQPYNKRIITVIILGFAGIFGIYILIVQWWFTRPLVRLSKGIQHVGSGDFDYKIDMGRKDEFGDVAAEFNHMSYMVKKLIAEVQLANQQKAESDFNMLLSQINPHFLYNTLDAINIMIDVKSKGEIHDAFHKLVGLLQYGLDKRLLRRLDEELTYVEDYISLLKIRFGNLFDYRIEKEPGTGGIRILKLLLQPLIENAIFHGIHPLKGRKGFLLIKAWREDAVLNIEISDNGVGMSEKVLKAIRSDEGLSQNTGGMGVNNVHNRIRLYCGKQYGMTINSPEGEGTKVLIRLPVETEDYQYNSS